jgi:hypothetical protein
MNSVIPHPRGDWGIGDKLGDCHGVLVSTGNPLKDHGTKVVAERLFIAAPHFGGWMIDPSLGLAAKGTQDLVCLDPLFAKSAVIKCDG